jgi:outer membrane receptor protein involved in Fe transport
MRLAVIGAVLLALAPGAFAQSKTTSAITAQVRTQDGSPIVGATVSIESPQLLGGVHSQVSDAGGNVRFPQIAPGMYSITVVMPGYKTLQRDGVRLQIGITLDLHLDLTPFAGQEVVTVTGEAPAIDVTSPQTNNVLTNEILQNLPASQFQPDTLNLAPGINQSVAWGGASDTGVAWQLDGVDTSDPEAGSAWSFVNYNIIDQVELSGLGAPAENGGFSGVVFNSTTKSGSNQVSGLFDAYYTNQDFTSSNGAPEGLNPTQVKYINTTANIGGPFIKDKLWWYISGQYYNNVTNNGGPNRNEESPRVFAKLSWQVNANNIFDAWVEWDKFDVTGRGGDSHTPLEATVTETAPEYVWNFAWKSVLSNNLILDVTFQGYTGYYYLDPASGYGLPGLYDGITADYSQNSVYYYKADRDRNQLNAAISQHVADWGGTHDFKFGMELERSTLRSQYGYPTGQWIYNNYYGTDPGDPTQYGYIGTAHYYGASYDLRATNQRVSAFAQDDWQITPTFTLNPGIRLDYFQGKVPELGKVYDYLAPALRLGFAWNISGDNQNLLKFHIGRYYNGLHATYYYWVDPGAFENSDKTIDWPSGPEVFPTRTKTYAIDPDLKQPYMDQIVLGYDRALPLGMVFSITGIYRQWKQFVETVALSPSYTAVVGDVGVKDSTDTFVSTGQTVTMYDWNNFDTDTLLVTNPSGLKRTYKGAMLTLTKNFSHNWQATASYVYSQSKGNIDNVGFDGASDSGGQDAGPSPFLDTPNSQINWNGNLTHDPTNQFKLQGTYAFRRASIWLSADWTYYTGDTYTKKSQCLLVPSEQDPDPTAPPVCHSFPQDGIAKVRYFAEPRGDRRLPDYNQVNFRFEWRPSVGKKGSIGLLVDVFNLFNHGQTTSVQDRDNGSFGEVLTYNIGRNIRFGARYQF